jgi:hypothetical protein
VKTNFLSEGVGIAAEGRLQYEAAPSEKKKSVLLLS